MACQLHARPPHRISRAYNRVQQRAVAPAGPTWTEGRFDGLADMPEVAYPGGHVRPGCRHVLVEQLAIVTSESRLPSGLVHREQLTELLEAIKDSA